MLKKRIAHNYLPDGFNSFQIPPTVVELVNRNNENTRQRLTDRCEKILQRTKSDLMAVYTIAADNKMNEYTMKFDTDMAQLNEDQRSGPIHAKFTEIMLKSMERRLKNIAERFEYRQNIKFGFFVQAPMIKN